MPARSGYYQFGDGGPMLAEVLALLDALAARTAMYVHPVEVATVQSYLHGLEAGCSMGGLAVSGKLYVAAAAARGWEFRATGIVWHMRERGLDDSAVNRELVAVQSEAFRLAVAQTPNQPYGPKG